MIMFCSFCATKHDYEAPCHERDKAFARLEARNREEKRKRMTVEREWPPEDSTLKQWVASGLECAVAQGYSLCGYAKVPTGHPCENLDYDDVDVKVHGGLTFRCKAIGGGTWFGFDTGHADDWLQMPAIIGDIPGRIWAVDDVAEETNRLAAQLATMPAKPEEPEPGRSIHV